MAESPLLSPAAPRVAAQSQAAPRGPSTHQFAMAVGKSVQDFIHNAVGQEGGHSQLDFTVEKSKEQSSILT